MPALLLDFNGVIVNDEEQHREALTATLGELGIPLSREAYYAEYLGLDDQECFRRALGATEPSATREVIRRALEAKGVAYRALISQRMELVPGVIPFVEAASRQGLAMGIVSAARREEIEFVLRTAGILDLVDAIVAAEDVTSGKPSPEGYLYGLDLLRADPEESVAVEDSLPGMRAARAAGLRVVAVTTSLPADALREADRIWTDFLGRDPEELPWDR